MKTIICNFKSNGENVKVTAVINDALTELSKSKKNQATNIIDDFILEDEEWGIFFEVSDNIGYEVQFKTNDGQKTLKPVKAITWEGGADAVITDVQKVKITVK
jgi:hypothetical protein